MGRRFLSLAILLIPLEAHAASKTEKTSPLVWREAMVRVRDGIKLQTVILSPEKQKGDLPILLERTPYGVPHEAPGELSPSVRALARDGYIFVYQNLRGRFRSGGEFTLSSRVDLTGPTATNETTDAYDTIDWLIKNVPHNNGRVGIWGVSYDGLTAAMTLLHPHPALKAVSEQASPVDQWMNDDMHRYGALRESYAMEYSVLEQAAKSQNTNFSFDIHDTYSWYLNVGPLASIDRLFLHGKIPFWNSIVQHPNYDAFWKAEAWTNQLHSTPVPTLNVAGFWDQEDPWGPWEIFRHEKQNDPEGNDFMTAGPWCHGCWHLDQFTGAGAIAFGGHNTAEEYREKIERPFFRYFLHDQGAKFPWTASTFQTGSNRWKTYAAWPPPEAKPLNVYLRADGRLSFDAPPVNDGKTDYAEYLSDPIKPVPYRPRPISPTYPGGDWPQWEFGDQRFVSDRPDVLSFSSAPLEHDVTVTGPIAAVLFASTSGTDSDFILKLIDIFPENSQKPDPKKPVPATGEFAQSLNGYELPIAMEVRRGRFNTSYEQPSPLTPNAPTEFRIPLRDHDHVFREGHRIAVQVQSTWFPVIDRNPQKFIPSIYAATPSDFQKATQRVYFSPALPSRVVLPVVP